MAGFQLFCCIVTGVICGAGHAHFPEHLISLPFGEFMILLIHCIYVYVHYGLMTVYGLIATLSRLFY